MKMLSLSESLKNFEQLMHELSFRDKVKSAEYHYAAPFDFDGFFDDALVDSLFNKILLISKEVEFDSFKLGVSWPFGTEEAEKSHLKHSVQTALIEKLVSAGKRTDFLIADVEFLIDFQKKLVLLRIRPVYFSGYYTKHVRTIAQTEYFCNKCRGKGCWYCMNTGHFCSESIEQIIAKKSVSAFKSKLMIMHGAGREDMDVLMLGRGRPFIAEMLMPLKRSVDLKKIEQEINSSSEGKISVSELKPVLGSDVSILKDSLHDKIYSAYVIADKKIDCALLELNKKIDVKQVTPSRVESRRSNMVRNKVVEFLNAEQTGDKEFVLTLRTSHGTYVKEFISSDGGKTTPSVSSILGANCTCKLLDVMEICE